MTKILIESKTKKINKKVCRLFDRLAKIEFRLADMEKFMQENVESFNKKGKNNENIKIKKECSCTTVKSYQFNPKNPDVIYVTCANCGFKDYIKNDWNESLKEAKNER